VSFQAFLSDPWHRFHPPLMAEIHPGERQIEFRVLMAHTIHFQEIKEWDI
jgi:hypothetical protein